MEEFKQKNKENNKSFGEVWKSLTEEQRIFLSNYIDRQRKDILKEEIKKFAYELNKSELNEKAKKYIENAGYGAGTNITLNSLKTLMVDFYIENQKKQTNK